MTGLQEQPVISAQKSRGISENQTLSYREYAVDAFEAEAVHYLLKPVTDERLYQAMDRALNRSKQEAGRTMALIKSGSTHIFPIRDILYCEVFDHRESEEEVNQEFDRRQEEAASRLQETLNSSISDFVKSASEEVVRTVETSKKEREKKGIEDFVKDHQKILFYICGSNFPDAV